MRTLLVILGAMSVLALASGGAGAGYYHSECWSGCWPEERPYYPPHPASNFSAYYYQSAGGIGRARSRPHVHGYRHHDRGSSK